MRETNKMGLWHAFSSTEKEKTMLNEKEFYQYVEANILNYLPEMEGKKVMVQRVKRNNQISMMKVMKIPRVNLAKNSKVHF